MPIEELLAIVRNQPDPHQAWAQVLELCGTEQPSKLWASLPKVDLDRDAEAARAWLVGALANTQVPTGVYLGLDTLNMEGGKGSNVEVGWIAADTSQGNADWAYGGLTYGEPFLIAGLLALHDVYSLPQWDDDFSFADYVLFLAYSGLVIREALNGFTIAAPMLFAWGFHDGDLFCLCRSEGNKIEMLCS
ncbi:MAG TPA: hypothetical protein VJO99_02400 [Burkholderiaceae bacterium]|nr:hypothetical protein [Burkholderiaceae bacterium]